MYQVSALMEKLERNKQRKQDSVAFSLVPSLSVPRDSHLDQERNLQSQIEHLQVELAETRSAVQGERAVREALEEVRQTPWVVTAISSLHRRSTNCATS